MFAVLEFGDSAMIIILVLILVSGSAYARLDKKDQSRLRRLESNVDAILHHLEIENPDQSLVDGMSAKVRQLADEGEKIPAIKAHRKDTGVGLKEAKEAVERYMGH